VPVDNADFRRSSRMTSRHARSMEPCGFPVKFSAQEGQDHGSLIGSVLILVWPEESPSPLHACRPLLMSQTLSSANPKSRRLYIQIFCCWDLTVILTFHEGQSTGVTLETYSTAECHYTKLWKWARTCDCECCFTVLLFREDDEADDVPATKRKRDISNVPPLTAFFTSTNTSNSNSADSVKNPALPRHRFLKNCGLMRVQNLWQCLCFANCINWR